MSVAVHCPTCGQELVAPDELIGQIAACPGCNAQFPITDTISKADQSPDRQVVPPPPPTTGSVTSTATTKRSTAAAQPAKQPPTADAYFPPGKAPQRQAPPTATPSPSTTQSPSKPNPRPRQTPPATPPSSTPRTARPAKFIAGESTATAIELGQDGRLPMLVLAEGKSKEVAEADGQKSNPLLMVGVLCFSLLASLSMLLIDTNVYRTEPDSKTAAREQIEAHYVQGRPLREPYQEVLAAALQAHHKGDYSQERSYYKQVLKMLREENKNAYTGITGRVSAPVPPNDDHLDTILRTLLR